MTPAARLQAAVEILDEVIASARDDGPAADAIVARYFKTRRYAGSKDRRAVRELVFQAIRRTAERPSSGREAALGLAEDHRSLAELFGEPRGPEPRRDGESASPASLVPEWLRSELSPLVASDEWPALLERAPLDLRVNVARSSRETMLSQFPGSEPTALSRWGLRLPAASKVDDHPAFCDGLIEVQDEGSQLIALACEAHSEARILDLCAGAGGKALAIAAAAPFATILAADTNRNRLSHLPQRAGRADATIETRLLDPGRELARLDDWAGKADLVLVDAPCSGSGTWRRNPEGRWRLTPDRLNRVLALQARLLDIATELVRPGGTIVYAVCSLLRREGAGQAAQFLARHSPWVAEETPIPGGRSDGDGKLLTPAHDSTDGFFIARLKRP
jgi:16S rRNA (cytosine967-C5)-methyltransferase